MWYGCGTRLEFENKLKRFRTVLCGCDVVWLWYLIRIWNKLKRFRTVLCGCGLVVVLHQNLKTSWKLKRFRTVLCDCDVVVDVVWLWYSKRIWNKLKRFRTVLYGCGFDMVVDMVWL